MKLNLDPKKNSNLVGEALRDAFFNQEKGFGCYSTFELLPDVEKLPNEPVLDNEDEDELDIFEFEYVVAKKIIEGQEVIMKYYWEGDGTLEFHFNGGMLYNTDCKKDYTWEFVSDEIDD
jgi:hypothetical protein